MFDGLEARNVRTLPPCSRTYQRSSLLGCWTSFTGLENDAPPNAGARSTGPPPPPASSSPPPPPLPPPPSQAAAAMQQMAASPLPIDRHHTTRRNIAVPYVV